MSKLSDSQMREQLDNLQRDNDEFLAKFPNARKRTTEQNQWIKSIRNKITKLKHRIGDSNLFERKAPKSKAERNQEYRERLSTLEKQRARENDALRKRLSRSKQAQFKCSVCDPEQAFEKRETLMRHIEDHHKPASPTSNQTEAKAVSRSDEEYQKEQTVPLSQDSTVPTAK